MNEVQRWNYTKFGTIGRPLTRVTFAFSDDTLYQCGWTEGVVVADAGSITNVAVGERVLFPVSPEGNQKPVSKPNITAECLNGSISLSCFSSQGSEVTYSWETLPPCGDDSCVHLGATVEIHPSSESTLHRCTSQNPVSRATSDPIDLGVCSIQQPSVYQCGWTEGVVVAAAGSITNVTVGERVLFPVSPEGNQSVIIELTFNSTTVISWSSRRKVPDVHDLYVHRIDIVESGSMHVNNMQHSDSGLYQMLIQYMSGDHKPSKSLSFHLQVLEPVSKPNITAECLNGRISLSCFSSQGSEVTYSWETLPPCGNDSCVHLGATVEIHPSSESTEYTCTAQNPVSRATSDPIDLGVCSIQQPPGGPWVLVLCGTVLTVLFLISIQLLHKRRNKKQKRNSLG
ncbi:hypothetical protein JZ751_018635 [Albula glossodonta]|uniref:Ig-like domain-containing protein n=1 Tax=Albula glossodonta TaxID=121402 RepID=A0A8T2MVJ1_9TELE|nr:hypothetical protein JZ751_018635 [Albula glossodonta]